MAENATSETERSAIAEAAREKSAAEKRAALEAKVTGAIALVQSDPRLSAEEKAKIIAQLSAALSGANLPNVDLIIANADRATQIEANEYYADAATIAAAEAIYPDYGKYSDEGKAYIHAAMNKAFEKSPTLRNLTKEYAALPEAMRIEGAQQAENNWKTFENFRHDPAISAKYHEQLLLMRGLKAPSTPQGAMLIEMIKDGKDPAEIDRILDVVVKRQAQVTQQVVAEILPSLEASSKKFIEGYGNPPDAERMVRDWAKISQQERDEAYKAFMRSPDRDISKLPPEQQKILHLSTVMVGADAAQTFQAGIEMVRDKTLEKKLLAAKTTEARGELLEEYMQARGFTTWDPDARDKFAREFFDTFEHNPQALTLLRAGKVKEVGALYASEIQRNEPSNAAKYSPLRTALFVTEQRAEAEIPAYIRDDPEKLAVFEKNRSEWQIIEKLNQSYIVDTQAAGAVNPVLVANAGERATTLTPEAQTKADDALRAENSVKAYYDGLAKAAAAAAPPPGITVDAIAAAKVACAGLCDAGVTGSAAPYVSGVPPEGVAVPGAAKPAPAAGAAPAQPR